VSKKGDPEAEGEEGRKAFTPGEMTLLETTGGERGGKDKSPY